MSGFRERLFFLEGLGGAAEGGIGAAEVAFGGAQRFVSEREMLP